MKRAIMFWAIVAIMAICSVARAANIGDTIEPLGKGEISVSLTNNIIFDKDYKSSITLDEMDETYAKIAIGANDNLNLYAILGRLNSEELTESETDYSVKFESDSAFLYGLGINNTYNLSNGCFVGGDLHYLTFKTDIEKISGSIDTYSFTGTDIKGDHKYYEIQGTIYAGKRFDTASEISYIPYLGMLYNYSEIEASDISFTTAEEILGSQWIYTGSGGSVKNDNKFGVMLGTNVEVNDAFTLNLEGRFISEEALTIGGTYKF